MRHAFIVLLALTSVFVSCDDDDGEHDVDSIEHFRVHLKADMKYDDIVRTFGEPDDDIGSGLHIYVYNLKDGTKVKIGYADKIFYASHVDANDQLLDVLI
jgi:hypothetical protein